MSAILKFLGREPQAHQLASSGAGEPPSDNAMSFPAVDFPPIAISQIAAEAVAVNNNQKPHEEGLEAIKQYHKNVGTDAYSQASAGPAGMRSTMQMELATVKADIAQREALMRTLVKGDEVAEDVSVAKNLAERVQLGVTMAFTGGLAVFSVTTMHTFLESQAIASGTSAWLTAIGVFCSSYVLEIPLFNAKKGGEEVAASEHICRSRRRCRSGLGDDIRQRGRRERIHIAR